MLKFNVGEAVKTIKTNIALKQDFIGNLRFQSTMIGNDRQTLTIPNNDLLRALKRFRLLDIMRFQSHERRLLNIRVI